MSNELDQIFVSEDKKEVSEHKSYELPHSPGINSLRVFGVIVLVFGLIGSVIIWLTMSTMIQSTVSSYGGGIDKETVINPVGITLGFVVFFVSIFLGLFSWVVSTIGDYLIAIHQEIRKISKNNK
jgi:hypothetical protein